MLLADTHSHLHMKHFKNDLEQIVEKDVKFILNIATNVKDLKDTVAVSERFEKVYAAVGIHPHDSKDVTNDYLDVLKSFANHPKVLAIGEIGLDYYRNLSPQDIQKKVFAEQLMLAEELDLPVVVHIREAYEDAYDILTSFGPKKGVIHSFSADKDWALKFVKLGYIIGIGGPVTYPSNETLRNAVKFIGEENILTETDCPYLPPQQFRGQRNEPYYVKYVVEKINELYGKDVSEKLFNNAVELFLGR